MQPATNQPALACVPGVIPPGDRDGHFSLIKRLFTELVLERQEIASGYAFRFDANVLPDIARFIGNERKCCPFLTFHLTVTAGSGPAWLRIEGPEGTRAFLDSEILG